MTMTASNPGDHDFVGPVKPADCEDCGTPYRDCGADLVLPDDQWLLIAPPEALLCASCICRRFTAQLGVRKLSASIDLRMLRVTVKTSPGDVPYRIRRPEFPARRKS